MSQQESSSDGLFSTAVFAVLLLGGVFVGHQVANHVVSDAPAAQIFGYLMIPLGVIVGLSFGQGVPPPVSLLNLFSVFDGRHTVEEVAGGSGAAAIAMAITIGTAATCAVLAGVVSTFLKPEIALSELMLWFGTAGLVYGGVVAGMVFLTTETK